MQKRKVLECAAVYTWNEWLMWLSSLRGKVCELFGTAATVLAKAAFSGFDRPAIVGATNVVHQDQAFRY